MEGDETAARRYAEQARHALSGASIGLSALDRSDGRMYLYLAEHFPQKDYAVQARRAFDQSLLNTPSGDSYLSQTLIHKANAALLTGELHEYKKCLKDGTHIAHRLNSEILKQRAGVAWGKAPEDWKREQALIDIALLFA